jgi:hypothetical protein
MAVLLPVEAPRRPVDGVVVSRIRAGRPGTVTGPQAIALWGDLSNVTTVLDVVNDGFRVTGRRPGAVANRIHDTTCGHPQRTMLLADAAWTATRPNETADDGWGDALQDVRAPRRGHADRP